jgi:hypothetical protein
MVLLSNSNISFLEVISSSSSVLKSGRKAERFPPMYIPRIKNGMGRIQLDFIAILISPALLAY